MKRIVLGISGGISFLIFLVLLFITVYLGGNQLTQTMAERWSEDGEASQVSCFFSVDSRITEDAIIEFEHTVDGALADASVLQESENPGARLWADAYSADGQVTLSTGKTNLTADAIGIGGDFFLFHPVKLLYGSYFSGNDLMQDYCVIDEDAAWQLFGSSDVAGMMVEIGGIPHIVVGVVERPAGRLAEAAGLDSTLVYVSYKTLSELGQNNGINHYEIVMPDPVTGFAVNFIREKLGNDEKETEVVENTSRYSLVSRLKLLTQFGTRSMNGRAIIYPYWENIARGYEDILTLLTLFEILFLIYPLGLVLVFFCIWWRHKGWTLKDVWRWLLDKAQRRMEKIRENRKNRKTAPKTAKPERNGTEKKKNRGGKDRKKKSRKKSGSHSGTEEESEYADGMEESVYDEIAEDSEEPVYDGELEEEPEYAEGMEEPVYDEIAGDAEESAYDGVTKGEAEYAEEPVYDGELEEEPEYAEGMEESVYDEIAEDSEEPDGTAKKKHRFGKAGKWKRKNKAKQKNEE